MTIMEDQKHPNYFRVAWQSALAAMLCFGLPAGLLFWLILFQRTEASTSISRMITLLQDYGILEIALYLTGALTWGIMLARISGYHPEWRLAVVTVLGASAGRWSPLTNLDGVLSGHMPGLPVHVVFSAFLSGFVFSVTAFVGLAYGLMLRSLKATLTLALTASLPSMLATLLMIVILDQAGIRVGMGDSAMPKVTAVCTLASAIVGGAALGIGFSRFVGRKKT